MQRGADAGGLTPAKDGSNAMRHFIRRTLPILNCAGYKRRIDEPATMRLRVPALL